MFGYAGHQGQSAATCPKTKMDDAPMTWQENLACIGVIAGLVILIYLLCRWCRSVDSLSHSDEPLNGSRERVDVPVLGAEVPAIVVHPQAIAPILLPSAEAEPQYYSRR